MDCCESGGGNENVQRFRRSSADVVPGRQCQTWVILFVGSTPLFTYRGSSSALTFYPVATRTRECRVGVVTKTHFPLGDE